MPKSHQRVVDTTATATPSRLDPKPALDVEADANVDAVDAASADARRWRLNDFYDYSSDEMDASVLEAVLKRPSPLLPETSSHDMQSAYPPRRKRANLIESDSDNLYGSSDAETDELDDSDDDFKSTDRYADEVRPRTPLTRPFRGVARNG